MRHKTWHKEFPTIRPARRTEQPPCVSDLGFSVTSVTKYPKAAANNSAKKCGCTSNYEVLIRKIHGKHFKRGVAKRLFTCSCQRHLICTWQGHYQYESPPQYYSVNLHNTQQTNCGLGLSATTFNTAINT